MQRTEKYFEQDAFRTGCESVILAAEPDEKTGGGSLSPGAVRVSQGVVHELLVHRRLDSHAELGLAAAAALQRIVHGHD